MQQKRTTLRRDSLNYPQLPQAIISSSGSMQAVLSDRLLNFSDKRWWQP